MIIDLDDLAKFDNNLAEEVQKNTRRYVIFFADVVSELLQKYDVVAKDSLDVYIEHTLMMENRNRRPDEQRNVSNRLPPELTRRFEINFKASDHLEAVSVRELRANDLGKLVKVRGIVTNCTEVKPMIVVATYTCDHCGAGTYQSVNRMQFVPLSDCTSEICRIKKANGRLHHQIRGSKFVKFQEMKIQEHTDQTPNGHIPLSLKIICRADTTRVAQSGDYVLISGVYLPTDECNPNQCETYLHNQVYLEAHHIITLNSMDSGLTFNNNMISAEIEELSKGDFYEKIASSLAPEIYGHLDIKKVLLLMLVGGVDKSPHGMKIRGNINICLVGDPGVAKSQLLRYISDFAVRSQYTTGRGSSGVGLTAAVTKDPITGQMILEGGALVLADQGVCCIDEFDKMADTDRTAIHEVMEQQTISIAKAGIMTSLNARVSILAAANPVYGRYNFYRSMEQNIKLPAALLSRFDVLWLIQDKRDRGDDLRLAHHVTYVHSHGKHPPSNIVALDKNVICKYIALCKLINPTIPMDLTDYIVNSYVELRREARNNCHMTFTSARNLLGIIRLATALARLRLANTVEQSDVTEALRLFEMSKDSLNQQSPNPVRNTSDTIFASILELAGHSKTVKMADIVDRCATKGYNPDQIDQCIEEYEKLEVWKINQSQTNITFN